jgi:predicted dehydrogenase
MPGVTLDAMDRDRRQFLASALAAAPLFVPRSAWGANDRLSYGLIGAGGRGRYLQGNFQKLGAECVAVAEVYDRNLDAAVKATPGAKPYVDYHDLLAQPGVDAVVIASPDHQHYPMLQAALDAKKDVYLEKPMSHSLAESKLMIQAVRKTSQIVQIGMQRRSAPSVIKAKEIVDSGILGKITMVKPMWNWNVSKPLDNSPLPGKLDWRRFLGSAHDRDLEPMRFRSWRYFWDYSGGNMTDQGTHLMDVVQWFTNSSLAVSAVCAGQKAKNTGSEVPDVFCAVFEYEKLMATWTLNYCNSYENDWSIQFQGDEGTMILNNEGFRIWKEPVPKNPDPIQKMAAPIPIETHIQNFMDCVKSRKEPNAPVEVGASAVSAPHLANVAYHQRRQVRMDEAG